MNALQQFLIGNDNRLLSRGEVANLQMLCEVLRFLFLQFERNIVLGIILLIHLFTEVF